MMISFFFFLQKNPVSVTGNEILREGVPLMEAIDDVAIRL